MGEQQESLLGGRTEDGRGETGNAEYVEKMKNKQALIHINPPRRNKRSWKPRKRRIASRQRSWLKHTVPRGPPLAAWDFLIEKGSRTPQSRFDYSPQGFASVM